MEKEAWNKVFFIYKDLHVLKTCICIVFKTAHTTSYMSVAFNLPESQRQLNAKYWHYIGQEISILCSHWLKQPSCWSLI